MTSMYNIVLLWKNDTMVKDKPINLDEIAFSKCCSKRKTKKTLHNNKIHRINIQKKKYTQRI